MRSNQTDDTIDAVGTRLYLVKQQFTRWSNLLRNGEENNNFDVQLLNFSTKFVLQDEKYRK